MPSIGSLIASAVQGAVSALLGPIVALFKRQQERADDMALQRGADQKSENEIKDEQLRAAANRPDTAADLDQRLRSGKA